MPLQFPAQVTKFALVSTIVCALALSAVPTRAAVSFLGVASGDASSADAVFWTRAVDTAAPASTTLTLYITTDPAFATVTNTSSCPTDPAKDYTCKVSVSGLSPNTRYYYKFVGALNEQSNVGRIKTAPIPTDRVAVHFGFSGDYDGLMRPFALASVVPSQNLDFYMNLGDLIYETASNVPGTERDPSNPANPASWLNSPSVTLSGSSSTLDGIPTGVGFATHTQLKADYEKKYRENLLPVNAGGQNSLQNLYAGQGNYTTYDNHELGNRQYINGGAPAGGPVGGPTGDDMVTGRGVDARAYTGTNTGGSGNVNNVNDTNTSAFDYMNRSVGFMTLRDVLMEYQPMADRGTVSAPMDPRTDGTKKLYLAQQWGKNAIFINTDTRSYRDLRLKTSNGAADDTAAPRANNPGRTYLGATQLAWLKQTLLDAQNAGTPWKFVSVSDPIDQLGPIGSSLALQNLPSFGAGSTYSPVNADGGKSWMGGYRAERNDLLRFIADNRITNVVFIATDDHQNRINEVAYSPSGQTEDQSTYIKVPYVFSIVAGPLGATGPDLITNHTFAMAQQYANSIYNAQVAAGIEPLGLIGYPGLHDLFRDGDATANTNPQPVDYYSPDTFNFTVLDISADGRTLMVSSIGMNATAQNAALEYANGPQARLLFNFSIDALPVTRSISLTDLNLHRVVQKLILTNNTGASVHGPIEIVLTNLSPNTTLMNATGTVNGNPSIRVQSGDLASGAMAVAGLQFTAPTSGVITYDTQVVTGP